jgi:hypothetical protein
MPDFLGEIRALLNEATVVSKQQADLHGLVAVGVCAAAVGSLMRILRDKDIITDAECRDLIDTLWTAPRMLGSETEPYVSYVHHLGEVLTVATGGRRPDADLT